MSASPARLHYEITGPEDAPVVVLGHAVGTTLGMWDALVPSLTEHFRVLRYDHRGHGGSEVPPGPYSIAGLSGDVLALLDALGLDRVLFGGLSLGGMVGMWIAAHAPQRIDRLALCCTSAFMPPLQAWDERAAAVREYGTANMSESTIARWFTLDFRERDPDTVTRAADMLRATPDEGYAGCCEALGGMDLRDDLGVIEAPTLVIAGADDPATPPEHAHTIAAGIAGCRVETIENAAHLAAVEQPRLVADLLLDHFAE